MSLTFQAEIIHSYRKSLVHDWAAPFERRFAGPANWVVAGAFLLSIPIALVSVTAAELIWLLVFVAGRWVADRLGGEGTR